jgi:hypothetical protein
MGSASGEHSQLAAAATVVGSTEPRVVRWSVHCTAPPI